MTLPGTHFTMTRALAREVYASRPNAPTPSWRGPSICTWLLLTASSRRSRTSPFVHTIGTSRMKPSDTQAATTPPRSSCARTTGSYPRPRRVHVQKSTGCPKHSEAKERPRQKEKARPAKDAAAKREASAQEALQIELTNWGCRCLKPTVPQSFVLSSKPTRSYPSLRTYGLVYRRWSA